MLVRLIFKRKGLGKTVKTLLIVLVSTVLIIGNWLEIPLINLFPKIQEARASAISFICASSAAATSTAACSGQASGDLLLVFAFRSGSTTAPSLPAGWNGIGTGANGGGGTNSSVRTGWKVASSSSEGSGTWTNATHVVMHVYRGQNSSPIGNFAENSPNAASSVITYPAVTLSATDGSSWFAGFGGRAVAHADVATAPTNMTNRTSAGATPNVAGHDTNGPRTTNWPSTDVTIGGSTSKPNGWVIEILAAPVITVGTSGSHTDDVGTLPIPSADAYVGGAFTFIRDVGTANVTSIKIRETGTVNAETNLSNVKLFYKQEASCSTSIPGDATAFNSTPGTFNASSDVTVTGTISVSTSQICVYVSLDVGSGAGDGETIKLQITDPSADVLISAGTVSPATAVAIAGSVTLTAPSGPTTDQCMRHCNWFSGETEQGFFWAD